MIWRHYLFASLVILAAGCSRRQPSPETPGAALAEINACELLTAHEITSIQGAPPQNMTPSTRSQPGVQIAQCHFALPRAADSLNLVVNRRVPGAAPRTPVSLWREMFHRDERAKRGRDGKLKEEGSPQKIDSLGDEAFWAGGQFGGTLHVLKGESSIQLSVGGPGEEGPKLENLKKLARIVLDRVP